MTTTLLANSGTFLLTALVLGAVALLIAIVVVIRLRELTKPLARVRDSQDTTAMMTSILHTIDSTESKLDALTEVVNQHVRDGRHFIRHVGLVRYDAFEGVAGQQSYSLCLLDDHRNGLLLTYLTSPNTARSYAVTIASGEASRKLGDEERRALNEALDKARSPAAVLT